MSCSPNGVDPNSSYQALSEDPQRGRPELEARAAEPTAELTKTNKYRDSRSRGKTSCVPLSITHRYSFGPTCPTDIAISSISVD
jgi:hypothetical protein